MLINASLTQLCKLDLNLLSNHMRSCYNQHVSSNHMFLLSAAHFDQSKLLDALRKLTKHVVLAVRQTMYHLHRHSYNEYVPCIHIHKWKSAGDVLAASSVQAVAGSVVGSATSTGSGSAVTNTQLNPDVSFTHFAQAPP